MTITPADWGTNVLVVRSVDRAGNRGPLTEYYYQVKSTP